MIKKAAFFVCVFVLVPGALWLGVPASSHACSCAMPGSVEQELASRTAVFAGEVLRVSESSPGHVAVLFAVREIWKGIEQSQVWVHTPAHSASCGYLFEPGREYLVFAAGNGDSLVTGLCGRNALLSHAEEDLRVLGPGSPPTVQVDLAGTAGGVRYAWIAAALPFVLTGVWLLRRRPAAQ